MQELIKKIELTNSYFLDNMRKESNKAAAARARKYSLELTKLLKEYRQKSIEENRSQKK